MTSFLKPQIETAPLVKPLINIGCLFDIPTGFYLRGKHGESILNGGLGAITGIVGIGNNFKSTVLHYQSLSALNRIMYAHESSITTYDTEVNIHENRLIQLTYKFDYLKDKDIINNGIWSLTDSTIYSGNKWFENLKEYVNRKQEHKKDITVEYPFLDRDGKTLLKGLVPTFGEVDSLSELVTDDVLKMQEDNEIGESGANTMHMRLGAAKTRMFMELPVKVIPTYHYMLFTAQQGKDIVMPTGPISAPPTKKLGYLKNGDKLKGVSDKFFFSTSNVWHNYNSSPLINQGTKSPEYPKNPKDLVRMDTDLNTVSVRQLRSKTGKTGIVLEIIVSQTEGVLPTLTEFHYIKNSNRFGIGGTLVNFNIDLYPDLNLTRNTIRSKIDEDEKLRRAINITSELCQINEFWSTFDKSLLCTPKELYEDLKKLGYDWSVLLSTRGWWTVNNDKHPINFLSTLDLLNMRKGLYKPYWLKEK